MDVEQAQAMLYGLALGDAFGWPVRPVNYPNDIEFRLRRARHYGDARDTEPA